MIQRQTDIVVNATALATPNATEIAVAVTNLIRAVADPGQAPLNNPVASIYGNLIITPGTSTTAIVVKVYRGSTIGGTLLSTSTFGAAATVPIGLNVDVLDPAPGLTPQYTMSVTQTGGAGAGSVTLAAIRTDILSQ